LAAFATGFSILRSRDGELNVMTGIRQLALHSNTLKVYEALRYDLQCIQLKLNQRTMVYLLIIYKPNFLVTGRTKPH
jgi:hypothetical protein